MAIQMGSSLAIFIKTIYQKIKQSKKNSAVDVVNLPEDSGKDHINPSYISVNDNSHDEVYRMVPKQDEFLKKKMFEESTILSPRIKY